MAVDINKKYYFWSGIKNYRETDNLLHFVSPYSGEKCWLDYKKDIIDIIENLDRDKTLAVLIADLNKDESIVNNEEFVKAFDFLIDRKIITTQPYQGILTEDEVAMYYTNILHYEFIFKQDGLKLMEELKNKKICLVGLGGTGTSLILSLAGMGIGHIKLIDNDVLAVDNLPRQMLYQYKDIGKKKVGLMKDFITNLNPFIEVEPHDLQLDGQSDLSEIKNIFKDCDLIVVAADDPDYLVVLKNIQEICFELDIPFIGGSAADGFIPPLVIPGKTACIDCFMEVLPDANLLKDKKNYAKLRLGRFMSSHLSVPYFKLLEGNALVAREIIKFLLFQKSDLINHYYTSILSEPKEIAKDKNCNCNN
jgi:molybdopterin/thiamine biosynthesis adenylyltransferase